jgi:hypothetical protein
VITSSIPGRLRLRSEAFKDPDFDLEDIAGCPGVESWVLNSLTGSLLVNYDPESLDPVKAMQALNRVDPGALKQYAEYVEKKGLDPDSLFRKRRAKATGGEGAPASASGPADKEKELWNEFVSLATGLLGLAVSGFLGARKFHVLAGMFFLEATARHVWRYRRRVKPPSGPKGDYELLPPDEDRDLESLPSPPGPEPLRGPGASARC